jgi:uncharacterized membrane-anchored protein YitT (DUF2179 family)
MTKEQEISRYRKAKTSWRKKRVLLRWFQSVLFVLLGVLSAGFGLKGFLMPNGFIDGGVTGISLLINAKIKLPLGPLIILINIPFILL